MTVVINYPAAGGGSGGGGGGSTITSVNGQTGPAVTITPSNISALGIPTNWNASTNSPTLTSSVAPTGNTDFIVTVAGTTTLDGISTWNVGDIAYFGSGGTWQRIAAAPATGTALVKSDGAGGLISATLGADYLPAWVNCAVPIMFPPSWTMASAGAVTFGTALDRVYPSIWCYFASGALNTGSAAGFYYTVMSSTTVGQVFQNVYAPGSNKSTDTNPWAIPSSPTAFGATTPGTFAAQASYVACFTVNIAQNFLGKNGWAEMQFFINANNSANNKQWHVTLGGTTNSVSTGAFSTNTGSRQAAGFMNTGVVNAQTGWYNGATNPFGNVTTVATNLAIDTSSVGNKAFSLEILNANAADYMIIKQVTAIVTPGTP